MLESVTATAAIDVGPGNYFPASGLKRRKRKRKWFGQKVSVESLSRKGRKKDKYGRKSRRSMERVWQPEKTGGGGGSIWSPGSSTYAATTSLKYPYGKLGI